MTRAIDLVDYCARFIGLLVDEEITCLQQSNISDKTVKDYLRYVA